MGVTAAGFESWRHPFAALAMTVIGFAIPCQVAAQGASALWTEARGTIRPSVAPYTELKGYARITVGEGARLGFFHYRSCLLVTVFTGVVEIGPRGYTTSKGARTEVVRRQCPARVRFRVEGAGQEAGGLVMRGASRARPPRPSFAAKPSFVIVGTKALAAVRIVVAEGEANDSTIVGALEFDGARAFWPAGRAPLERGRSYVLRFLDDGGGELATLRFIVDAAGQPLRQAFGIIRID